MSTHFFPLTFCIAVAITVCSCSRPPDTNNFDASIASVQRYCDAFVGQNIDDVRAAFQDAQVDEGSWSEDGFGGAELVATYPTYEIRVLFLDDEAITSAITVLSR